MRQSMINKMDADESTPETHRPRLSEIIQSLDGTEALTLGMLIDRLGEGALGALMLVFAVPNMIPTPPGTSAILGLPLVILTFQLMLGRRSLWLPEKIRMKRIDGVLLRGFVRHTVPVLKKLEKILRPRFSFLIVSPVAERLVGLVCFTLSVILFLPIPLGNMLPAAAIAMLSVALAERDGLAALIGYALGLASFVVLGVMYSAVYLALKATLSFFWS